MVKQFTIPCSFNGETAPVTFYIGHPESGHHPINFQMNWLSSAKGGVVPQDLVDTLKNLQDLAYENGADFEEMCYYALISATSNNTTGNGVTKEAITGYADEFVKKELGEDYVEDTLAAADSQDNTQTKAQTSQQATSSNVGVQTAATSQPSSSSTSSGDSDLMDEIDQLLSSIDNADNNSSSGSGSSAASSSSNSSVSGNYNDNDDLLMGDDDLLSDSSVGSSSASSSQADSNSLTSEIDNLLKELDSNSGSSDISTNSSSATSSQASDDNSLANDIDDLLKELSGESVGKINGEVNTAVYGEDDDLLC